MQLRRAGEGDPPRTPDTGEARSGTRSARWRSGCPNRRRRRRRSEAWEGGAGRAARLSPGASGPPRRLGTCAENTPSSCGVRLVSAPGGRSRASGPHSGARPLRIRGPRVLPFPALGALILATHWGCASAAVESLLRTSGGLAWLPPRIFHPHHGRPDRQRRRRRLASRRRGEGLRRRILRRASCLSAWLFSILFLLSPSLSLCLIVAHVLSFSLMRLLISHSLSHHLSLSIHRFLLIFTMIFIFMFLSLVISLHLVISFSIQMCVCVSVCVECLISCYICISLFRILFTCINLCIYLTCCLAIVYSYICQDMYVHM